MKNKTYKKIAVIGGGPMGLSVTHELTKMGFKPELIEADDRLGGMAACFDFANQRIERYYHFHFRGDVAFQKKVKELGIGDKLKWKETKMGFFFDNRLYKWGSINSVISFPKISLFSRLRYLIHAFRCLTIKDWRYLDKVSASIWLKKWLGNKGFKIFWLNLFKYKFFEYSDAISAAWIWSRIKKLGKSRRFLKETLGYLEGGSDQLINSFAKAIESSGGVINLNSKVESIKPYKEGGGKIVFGNKEKEYDVIISTIPLPFLGNIFQKGGVKKETYNLYNNCKSIACACVILNLKRPFSENFWTNINDQRFKIPGIIEMSNLRPTSGSIVYIPFYMPSTNPDYHRDNNEFINDAWECLKQINKNLTDKDLQYSYCNRYIFAQPICETQHLNKLPPINPFKGIFTVDTTVYYPDDRGISESIEYGKRLAYMSIHN